MNDDLIIIDNFLSKEALRSIVNTALPSFEHGIMGPNERKLPYVLSSVNTEDVTPEEAKPYNLQLTHNFQELNTMEYFNSLGISDQLGMLFLARAKVNITFRCTKNIGTGMHWDISENNEEGGCKDKFEGLPLRTGILYINDCDGGTRFEDGTFIQSKANRYVEFPRELKHEGVMATDVPYRGVLNVNFIGTKSIPSIDKPRF